MQALEHLLHFNSALLATFLEDLEASEAFDTLWPNQQRSPVSLVGHLLASRGQLLALLLDEDDPTAVELQSWGQSPSLNRPPDAEPEIDMEALRSAWASSSQALSETMSAKDPEPWTDWTGPDRERLSFLVWHEIYHIGQLGFLRDVSRGPASMRHVIFEVRKNRREVTP